MEANDKIDAKSIPDEWTRLFVYHRENVTDPQDVPQPPPPTSPLRPILSQSPPSPEGATSSPP